jgi:hypothetical protein
MLLNATGDVAMNAPAQENSVMDVLRSLDLGSSVAEFDKSLEKYFVENEAFHALVTDRADVVAGDKGTGKTAVYRVLQKRYGSIPELKGVEVIAGFNPAGSPIFQRLVPQGVLSEGQYASVWKAYVLSLVGNWALEIAGSKYSTNFERLDLLLEETGLRSKDDKPETIFGKIISSIQQFLAPKKAEVEFTFSETGIPIVTPRLEFGKSGRDNGKTFKEVPHAEALRLLNDCLEDFGYTVWLALDRLDEAFQGFPDIEIPALRALLRSYLDLLEFPRLRLKLFVRRDLFKKIVGDGFVNLTHINARKKEILWEEADLMNLLCRRIRDNATFLAAISKEPLSDEQLFYRLFPDKVDKAERKPTTWTWMMSRIRDANDVKPPRNLIDLVNHAREAQIRAESRSPTQFKNEEPLIAAQAVRSAHERLSEQRVQDTLLAESAKDTARMIERFRKSKSEHNLDTLASTLGLAGEQLNGAVRQLVEVGFLEPVGESWKVPMLYRDGLEVRQGKAFGADQAIDE